MERQNKLTTYSFEEIKAEIEKALPPNSLNILALSDLVNYIHSLDVKERIKFKQIYLNIGDNLFASGGRLPQYNPSLFKEVAKLPKEGTVNSDSALDTDFADKLSSLLNFCNDDLGLLSRCFLLKIGNNKSLKYSYLLLHDFHSRANLFTKLNAEFNDNCKVQEIDKFIDQLQQGELQPSNFIVLLTLSSHMNPEDTILKKLNIIREYLVPIEQIVILPKLTDNYEWEFVTDLKSIEDEIKFLVSKDLKDMEIDLHTEKILKKMFMHSPHYILQYRKISVGYSGTVVLYVEPSGISINLPKYIVKVGKSEKTRKKIDEEHVNFKQYVDVYDIEYTVQYEKTEHCTAIRYNYAAKKSKISSTSFKEKFDDKMISLEKLKTSITNLFSIDIMSSWNVQKDILDINFTDHYQSFINSKNLYESLSIVNGINIEDVKELELYKIFNEIITLKIPSFIKICHGDLHSDNFFIDEEDNVFLIDFGDTGKWHSLIDYATLECSLKFRHVPRYIEVGLLMKIENELLSNDSFNTNFSYSNINRADLKRPFELISLIRQQTKRDRLIKDVDSPIEYLYSIFMITIRQIIYPNLNQLYAIRSAEVIGRKILELSSNYD